MLIEFYWKKIIFFIIYFKDIFLPIWASWKHADSSKFCRVIVISVWVICLFYFFELIGFIFILIVINFEDLHKLCKINFIIDFFVSLFMKFIWNFFNIKETEIVIIFGILHFIVVNKWKPLWSRIWMVHYSFKSQLMGRYFHFILHL